MRVDHSEKFATFGKLRHWKAPQLPTLLDPVGHPRLFAICTTATVFLTGHTADDAVLLYEVPAILNKYMITKTNLSAFEYSLLRCVSLKDSAHKSPLRGQRPR
jgi:hypothetical protein